jgi:hypothetical protein
MSRILLDNTNTPASERSYQIPWIYDAHAYNMCNEMPERTINVTEGDWKKTIGNLEEVESLYIMTDLEEKDYEIIGRMINLKALYLYTARELKDISFIRELVKLKELLIHRSKVEDLTPIADLRSKQDSPMPWKRLMLVAIMRSEVSDLSPLKNDTHFSEFLLVESKVSEEDELYKSLNPYR